MAVANVSMTNYIDRMKNSEEQLNERCDSTAKAFKKKKAICRGKSICKDEPSDVISSDVSQDSLYDDCVFPSPMAITEEEALRETHGHFLRQNYHANSSGIFDDGNDDMRCSGYVNSRSSIRREMEKPPRLQKQLSRDRLPASNKLNSSTDVTQSNGTSHAQESGMECLDSTGVDVHEFLVKALQSNPRDRNILLKLERDMIKFVNSKENVFMRFPEMTSYHRMLVHRVAAYFGMDHNIDAKGKSVIINKTENTKIPEKKFQNHIVEGEEQSNGREENGRRSILKRMKNCQSLDHAQVPVSYENNWKEPKQKSYKEREDHYERTRARIFQERPRHDGFGVKPKMMQWKSRPWNSTDIESFPNKGSSTPPASSLATSALSKKANSYSGMTILSRQSNFKKDSISSSSSSSSLYQPHNDAVHGDNAHSVEEKQPINIQPGIYPPPSLNTESSDAEMPKPSSHVINLSEKHLIIAVPAGFHVEPGTVLTNPLTGIPYVNLEGQPILHPHGPLSMPLYSNVPLHYTSANVLPHELGPMQPSSEMNGMVQNGILQADGQILSNPPPVNIYHPANQLIYPYQAAPVHLYSYPVHPPQQSKPTITAAGANGHQPSVENLQNDVAHLQLTPACPVPLVQEQSDGNEAEENETTKDGENSIAHSKASLDSSLTSEEKENASAGAPDSQLSATNHSGSDSWGTQPNDKEHEEKTVDLSTNAQPIQADLAANGSDYNSTAVSTRLGCVTYYTAGDTCPPIQTGASGQTVFSPQPTNPPPMYPAGMLPYTYTGMTADGKFYRPILNQHPVPLEGSRDYFFHAPGSMVPPSHFVPNTAPPFYYMVNGQAMGQYQAGPLFYSPVSNGYPPQAMSQVPPTPFYDLTNTTTPVVQPQANGKPAESIKGDRVNPDASYPMSVVEFSSDVENLQLNAFAARHSAKIVHRESEDAADAATNDIFLLFPSSNIAFKALEEAKTENFRLSDITDLKQRAELLEQISAAK